MGLYTSEGLVKHAKKAYSLKTKYMWGGILRPIEQQYDMLFKMYGNKAGTGYTTARWNELSQLRNKGYYGCDCIGLVKSYYWSGKADGGTGSPKYGASGYPDINASYMYQIAKVKGAITDMPDVPGLIVYSRSHPHVGIYIGGGMTIESTLGSRGDGVVLRALDDFWEYWFECPYIEYPKIKTANTPKDTKTYRLAYPAVVRSGASKSSKRLDYLPTGRKVNVVHGTATKDKATGYTYVKITGDVEGWIVMSALG